MKAKRAIGYESQMVPSIRDKWTWIVVARDSSTCTDVAQAGVQW
jgi:hypothetical protein